MTSDELRDELARRLGVDPSRVYLGVARGGRLLALEIYVDGRDLTPDEEPIATQFLADHPDVIQVIGVYPSAPRTVS